MGETARAWVQTQPRRLPVERFPERKPMTASRVLVFGPAYLDRVLYVDRPLIDPGLGPPLDQSVDGAWKFGTNPRLELTDPAGYVIEVELPGDWPGPTGEIRLASPIRPGIKGRCSVRGLTWLNDLGGMGAGYAAALGGQLCSALGSDSDPTSREISSRLAELGIAHDPVRVFDHCADWTLLITSGEFGDKLPIGFRGCHAALEPDSLDARAARPCDLRVVASLPNRLAARVLAAPGAGMRFFAPAMRNVVDRVFPLSSFAGSIDVLSCNRQEWDGLEDREEVAWQVSILVVTDGPAGSSIRYTTPQGEPGKLSIPAFPRQRPPRDTNRAGASYAATLLSTLLDQGWKAASGVIDDRLIRSAALRSAAAAALVLDRVEFGFPGGAEIDAALAAGKVA
jgi:sugar/nucleoside kinase (ribokinase family)